MGRTQFDVKTTVQPVPSNFVESLVKTYGGEDRRDATRRLLNVAVPVVAVDDDYIPIGDPFVALTRDISESGISLFYTKAFSGRFYALELPSKQQLIIEVV